MILDSQLSSTNLEKSLVDSNGTQVEKSEVFFDILVDNEPLGRITITLFEDIVPKTVKNFKALAKGKMMIII